MTLVTLLLIAGCDSGAAERLRTCAGGNTRACYDDGVAAMSAAKPRFSDARKAFASACRPSVTARGAESSVSKHVPEACNELATLVRDAKGGPKDVPRAIDLFGIACKDGIGEACLDLAELLYTDDPELADDAVRAVVLFGQACDKVDTNNLPKQGPAPLGESCVSLGQAYESGIGVEPPRKDIVKAEELYRKGCAARIPEGCVHIGDVLVATHQRTKIEEAAGFYEQACELNPRFGCMELARLHEKKAWPGADDELAGTFYKKACAIDASQGCFEAAQLMEEGRVANKEGEIDSLYNQACEHGHSMACSRRSLRR
ncbi:MAG: tetratricopeptide repeat protein [Myxococcota bacterium]